MTRSGTNHRDGGPGAGTMDEQVDPAGAGEGTESHGDLVERLCHNAVQLLADVAHPPRSLRVRAGDVSVDVEWGEERAASGDDEATRPAVAGAGTGTTGAVPPTPAGGATAGGDSSVRYLTAPTVGTFYRAPEPAAPPFVDVGDTVTAGQQVGIVEAMKLMIPVEADTNGRISEVLKADGEPVEYGERLFALAEDAVGAEEG